MRADDVTRQSGCLLRYQDRRTDRRYRRRDWRYLDRRTYRRYQDRRDRRKDRRHTAASLDMELSVSVSPG